MTRLVMIAIDDEPEALRQIEDHCRAVAGTVGFEPQFTAFSDVDGFSKANARPDVLVVDLKLGGAEDDRSGWEVVKSSLQKRVVPVIVYSAYTGEGVPQGLTNLLIVPVKKGAEQLQPVLEKCSRLKLRMKQEHERVDAMFNGLTLEVAGKLLGSGGGNDLNQLDENVLASMSVARLATYLTNVPPAGTGKLPPEASFVAPPLQVDPYPPECLFLGDFLRELAGGKESHIWFVAAPSCDLVFEGQRKPKVQEVLLLRAYTNFDDVPFLHGKGENDRREALSMRVGKRSAKILKCPKAFFGSVFLVLSFKDYRTVPYDAIRKSIEGQKWRRIATLAAPYAEALQNQFISDLSRIGTPDTSTDADEKEWIKEFVKTLVGQSASAPAAPVQPVARRPGKHGSEKNSGS